MSEVKALEAVITDDPQVASVPYYFASKAGWMSNVPTLYGTAHVPAEKHPPTLPEFKTLFHFSEEKVPAFIFDQALDFFRKVYTQHKTEATTYICRDAQGRYSLFIPKQYVTGASVNHKVEAGEMGERVAVGTIHSHCMFSAFHSGTDAHDMGKMPGLHATIGMVMKDEPEYAVAIAVGDTTFDIEPHDIIDEDVTKDANGFNTAPDHWLKFVHANQRAPWQGGISTTYRGSSTVYQYGKMKKPIGFQTPNWMDDEGWDFYSSYKPSYIKGGYETEEEAIKSHLEITKRWLRDEVRDLAEMGFVLKWDIEEDPAEAQAVLESMQAENANDTLPMFGGRSDG